MFWAELETIVFNITRLSHIAHHWKTRTRLTSIHKISLVPISICPTYYFILKMTMFFSIFQLAPNCSRLTASIYIADDFRIWAGGTAIVVCQPCIVLLESADMFELFCAYLTTFLMFTSVDALERRALTFNNKIVRFALIAHFIRWACKLLFFLEATKRNLHH